MPTLEDCTVDNIKGLLWELGKCIGKDDVIIVGVGNPLRGDDGVGVLIAQRLRSRGFAKNVIVAGPNPENCISCIASKNPRVVIFVDAVNAGLKPGSVVFAPLPDAEKEYRVLSTHSIPLSLILRLIGNVKGYILGIQAANTEIGGKMHSNVLRAAKLVSDALEEVLLSLK